MRIQSTTSVSIEISRIMMVEKVAVDRSSRASYRNRLLSYLSALMYRANCGLFLITPEIISPPGVSRG